MSYMRDIRGVRLDAFDVLRDLPAIVLGNWDASTLQGAVGSSVDALPDLSGWAQDLTGYTINTKPMTIAERSGRKVVRTNGAANSLRCMGWGSRWEDTSVPSPVTVFAVAAASTTFDGTAGFPRVIWSGAEWNLSGTLSAASTIGATTLSTSATVPVGSDLIVDSGGNREVLKVVAVAGSSAPYTLTLKSPAQLAHASGVQMSTTPLRLQLDGTGSAPGVQIPLPSGGLQPGGAPLNDNNLHVHATVVEPNQIRHAVDGLISSVTAPGIAAGGSLIDLFFGGSPNQGLHGDIAQLIICRGALTPAQVNAVSQGLCAKWGVTYQGRSDLVSFRSWIDTSSANGQQVRIVPPAPSLRKSAGNPLVIWSHPHNANQQVSLNYFIGPVLSALSNYGCTVAGSNLHANNWGNTFATDDNLDLYNRVVQYFGTPSAVIMLGGSMGGLASLLAVPDGRIPNIKGVALIDGVCNLANLYAGGTYSAPIRTAHGIASDGSDYAAKTAGRDPILVPAAQYAGKRYRFYASTSDTDVLKANNTDAFATYLGTNALEKSVLTHAGGHLATHSAWAADVLAFVKRCLA
ncbi:alpha/beta hydrolase family protein [Rhodococcoides fascians]|uniref:alpha/beta hydrolase family protein n=1 Tax=Rhodococcoides fascians TaxID=1828 RepID=UPI00050D02FF|nr:alpha/beta hydrolase [Rhodococcus fascians]